jgi:ribosomal protein S18 acetylase RimI-like enzyme
VVDHGNVVGTVALKKIDETTAELKSLYLDKNYRGKGLGGRLMTEAVGAARARGYKSVVLDSMKKYKDARNLYEQFGFKDTERYNGNEMADVFMKLDL